MKHLAFLFIASIGIGCEGASTTGSSAPVSKPAAPNDPNIHVREGLNGQVGPIGGGRIREYDGPASKAPDWAKPKNK